MQLAEAEMSACRNHKWRMPHASSLMETATEGPMCVLGHAAHVLVTSRCILCNTQRLSTHSQNVQTQQTQSLVAQRYFLWKLNTVGQCSRLIPEP